MRSVCKNSVHTVEITDYASDGAGIARLENGCVVFVTGAARGDVCRVVITKALSHHCYGKIQEILSPSKHRIPVDCPAFDRCGGCRYRHITYEEELYAKRAKVDAALRRIGGAPVAVEEILSAGVTDGYRNKAQFPVCARNGRIVTGFYRPMSHDIVEIDACPLIDGAQNDAVRCVREWLRLYDISVYDEKTGAGLVRHVYTRSGRGGMTVCLVINGGGIPHGGELTERLRERCPLLTGLLLNINRERGNTVLGSEFITLWGCDSLDISLGELTFRLSPASFFQVNTGGALLLYDKAREYAGLTKDEFLLDLYCGTGTITLFLGRDARKALGVECVPEAVADARENAARNRVENVEFCCADASLFDTAGLNPDCVTVDPPRKGLTPGLLRGIEALAPAKMVYISCDPSTLARDIAALRGYAAKRVCAVDMFPRTAHVECVALLEKS